MTDLLEQDVVPPTTSYREIHLSQGLVALVDAEDYARIACHKWYAWKSKHTNPIRYYARRNVRLSNGKSSASYMHREVLGLVHGDPRETDHKERVRTLDNRKSNLRVSTHAQNMFNKVAQSNNTSGHKGVSQIKKSGRWNARIKAYGKPEHIGNFVSFDAACAAYCRRSLELHGEFSNVGEKG